MELDSKHLRELERTDSPEHSLLEAKGSGRLDLRSEHKQYSEAPYFLEPDF